MTFYKLVDSPIGLLMLASDGDNLTGVTMESHRHGPVIGPDWQLSDRDPILLQTASQLEEYFAGKRTTFDLPLNGVGTEFQCRCWKTLTLIPFGETWSYGEMAKRVGNPDASRAVGAANGKNPISIIVPCHRVIGSSGKLVGFGGGLPRKASLLSFERAVSFGELAEEFWRANPYSGNSEVGGIPRASLI